MADCGCSLEASTRLERRTLQWVLAINASMFLIELSAGLTAQSTGLLADSLDMLGDSFVYGISLLAVGEHPLRQRRIARFSGGLQIALAGLVLLDVVRRFAVGSEPVSLLIVVVGLVALIANLICLRLVARHRRGGLHMRASFIFSTNDTLANVGVIVSGLLVALTGRAFPDLLIGLLIACLVLWGGVRILSAQA